MSEKEQLYYAIKLFLNNKYSVKEFCSNFEVIYNLELDKSSLNDKESKVFKELFEKVVYYNEFPDERKTWPGFTSEEDIYQVIQKAVRVLSISHASLTRSEIRGRN